MSQRRLRVKAVTSSQHHPLLEHLLQALVRAEFSILIYDFHVFGMVLSSRRSSALLSSSILASFLSSA